MSLGAHRSVRRYNRSAILRLLRERRHTTRNELASLTGLTPASVTRIASEMIRSGLLQEVAQEEASKGTGRRPRLLTLNPARLYVAAMHVGVMYVDVGLYDLKARLMGHTRYDHAAANNPVASLELAAETVMDLIQARSLNRADMVAVGLGTGGWVDPDAGVIRLHPRLGWRDIPARQVLEEHLGVLAEVDNSVNGMALAEARFGAGMGTGSLVLLMVGNVIGASAVINGQLYHGRHQLAGQIGHTPVELDGPPCSCGNRGCLEAVAADSVLVREVSKLRVPSVGNAPTIERILALAETKPGPVREIVQRRAALLGRVIGTLVNLYDPAIVVVAGSAAMASSLQLPVLRNEALRYVFPTDRAAVRIEATSFGAHAGLVGAAALALESFYSPLLDVVETRDGHIRPILRVGQPAGVLA